MYVLLSPAKALNLHSEIVCSIATEPEFQSVNQPIVDKLKKMSPSQIAKTFSLSTKLAALNYDRYQSLGSLENLKTTRQAIFTFDGDVYQGFDAYSLDRSKFEFTQQTIRILSGLYGILRPFDLIEPYRLEMGSSISIGRKKNLYQYWSEMITASLNRDIEEKKHPFILNLASNEYAKAVSFSKIRTEVISVEFLEKEKGELKNISFYSKKARGLMSRYIVDHTIADRADLCGFDVERYAYDPKLSTTDKLIFTRKFQPIGKKV